MAVSLSEIMTTLQNGVEAVRSVTSALGNVFPQASSLSTSATTGGISYSSSQPAAFLTVLTSTGGSYKIPLFNT